MKIETEITLQVLGPEEGLADIGECYAIYRRRLSLEVPPTIGMIFSFGNNLKADDPRTDEFIRLIDTVSLKSMQLVIERVVAEIDSSSQSQLRLRAQDVTESTIVGFKNLECLLLNFYGFDRIV